MQSIFLDWDGVVVDSTQLYLDLLHQICADHDRAMPIQSAEGFRDWYRSDWEQNFYQLGFSHTEYLNICQSYPATLDYQKAPFFEGVEELIQSLASEHRLVVVSTAPTAPIEKRLREAGLLGCFESVTGSDDGSTEKEERLAEHLSRLGCHQGIMVGDTDLDIQAGRANGLSTVGIAYGMISGARVRAARPDYFVERPASLGEALRKAVARLVNKKATPLGGRLF
jgi:phosphoglycolate phosphatase